MQRLSSTPMTLSEALHDVHRRARGAQHVAGMEEEGEEGALPPFAPPPQQHQLDPDDGADNDEPAAAQEAGAAELEGSSDEESSSEESEDEAPPPEDAPSSDDIVAAYQELEASDEAAAAAPTGAADGPPDSEISNEAGTAPGAAPAATMRDPGCWATYMVDVLSGGGVEDPLWCAHALGALNTKSGREDHHSNNVNIVRGVFSGLAVAGVTGAAPLLQRALAQLTTDPRRQIRQQLRTRVKREMVTVDVPDSSVELVFALFYYDLAELLPELLALHCQRPDSSKIIGYTPAQLHDLQRSKRAISSLALSPLVLRMASYFVKQYNLAHSEAVLLAIAFELDESQTTEITLYPLRVRLLCVSGASTLDSGMPCAMLPSKYAVLARDRATRKAVSLSSIDAKKLSQALRDLKSRCMHIVLRTAVDIQAKDVRVRVSPETVSDARFFPTLFICDMKERLSSLNLTTWRHSDDSPLSFYMYGGSSPLAQTYRDYFVDQTLSNIERKTQLLDYNSRLNSPLQETLQYLLSHNEGMRGQDFYRTHPSDVLHVFKGVLETADSAVMNELNTTDGKLFKLCATRYGNCVLGVAAISLKTVILDLVRDFLPYVAGLATFARYQARSGTRNKQADFSLRLCSAVLNSIAVVCDLNASAAHDAVVLASDALSAALEEALKLGFTMSMVTPKMHELQFASIMFVRELGPMGLYSTVELEKGHLRLKDVIKNHSNKHADAAGSLLATMFENRIVDNVRAKQAARARTTPSEKLVAERARQLHQAGVLDAAARARSRATDAAVDSYELRSEAWLWPSQLLKVERQGAADKAAWLSHTLTKVVVQRAKDVYGSVFNQTAPPDFAGDVQRGVLVMLRSEEGRVLLDLVKGVELAGDVQLGSRLELRVSSRGGNATLHSDQITAPVQPALVETALAYETTTPARPPLSAPCVDPWSLPDSGLALGSGLVRAEAERRVLPIVCLTVGVDASDSASNAWVVGLAFNETPFLERDVDVLSVRGRFISPTEQPQLHLVRGDRIRGSRKLLAAWGGDDVEPQTKGADEQKKKKHKQAVGVDVRAAACVFNVSVRALLSQI